MAPTNFFDEFLAIRKWYQKESTYPTVAPSQKAALLQHKLISLHPFMDANGTVSRLLMNWSLEKDGYHPSALNDFDLDIFSTEEEWHQEVLEGSQRYERYKHAIETGETEDLSKLFGLKNEKDFYEQEFRKRGETPPSIRPGSLTPHSPYKKFLQDLRTAMR